MDSTEKVGKMKKIFLLVSLVLAMAIGFSACSQETKKEVKEAGEAVKEDVKKEAEKAGEEVKEKVDEAKKEVEKAVEEKTFTLEELKEFNGKDGKPAYVAVDGVVYDMTDVKEWKDGMHNGYEAGNDLTEIIKEKSPHGIAKLEGIKVVGTLKK